MSKNFKYYLGIWAVLLAIFNVAVFVSPNTVAGISKFGGAFWVGYIFITIAFIGQLVVSYFVFKAENLQKFFYKISLVRISWTGLVLTLVFGTLCMVIPNLPDWIGVIACFVVLAFSAISLVKANAAADIVGEIDDKIKTQTAFIKSLTADTESLMSRAKSEIAKTEVKKVYESVRYSDPMSNENLATIENEITLKFSELSAAVIADGEEITDVSNELLILIDDRNRKCKLLK